MATTQASVDPAEQLAADAVMPPGLDVDEPAWPWEGDAGEAAAAPAVHPVRFAHNLPVQLTSFVGRHAEMTQVRALLADSRMVTLTGAGGVGKTRLALQVAVSMVGEFPAGVWLVDLVPLTDPELVAVTVARSLGLLDAPGRSTMDTVTGFVGKRRALVILDNCEHLLDACALVVEEFLRACPSLVILATSREPVGAAGEATWRVPSLQLASEAAELFSDRARRTRPGFAVTAENSDAVAEICRRLDGIPLAIELAAARLRAFSPAEIAAGLHDRFRLLTGGSRTAARRQQTLRASVDWSHALLSEPERILFRRLAAFAGGFDLDAAEAIGAADDIARQQTADLLAMLVDKSLVNAEESDGATRYRVPETVRQYALEKLADSGEADQVRTLHRGYYATLASQLEAPTAGNTRRMIGRLEGDIDNLRAAFHWSLELSHRDEALRLASSLQPLWRCRCRMLEGLAWFETALATQPTDSRPTATAVRVRALADAAVLDGDTGTPRCMAQQRAEEAVDLARPLGDPALLGRALLGAGFAAGARAKAAWPYLAEAKVLARHAGDSWTLAQILGRQAFVAVTSGDPVAARTAAEEGLALAEEIGDDHTSRHCRTWLSFALIMQGNLHQGSSLARDLIAEADAERNLMWKMWGLAFLGYALALLGQPDEARAAGQASIAIADDLGLRAHAVFGYICLYAAALAAGDTENEREVTHAARHHVKREFDLTDEIHRVHVSVDAGDLPAARQRADLAISRRQGLKLHLAGALLASARVAVAAGDAGRASDDAHQALSIARDSQAQREIAMTLEFLGKLARFRDECGKSARLLGAAEAIRQRAGYQRFPSEQRHYQAAIVRLRSSMGDTAFGQAFDEGATLSLDDAVNYALRGRGERNRPPIGWLSLTPAEGDVARLVAEGLSNKDIADRLLVSPRTVQTHLTHMYGKLGITSRVQLAKQAASHS